MLARKFKFVALNNTGQTMTYSSNSRITLTYRPWKFSSSGVLTWGALVTQEILPTGTLANAAYLAGSVIDNSTDLYLGLIGVITYTTDHASTAGPIRLFYAPAIDDAGSVFPSNGDSWELGDAMITMAAAQTRVTNFEVL